MKEKIVVFACPWPGDSCSHTPQPLTLQVLPQLAPIKAEQAKHVANPWTPTSTIATGVGTAVVLIAGMLQ